MKRLPAIVCALLAIAAVFGCDGARAQARGPSAMEILANGQYVGSGNVRETVPSRRVWGWKDIPLGEPVPDPEVAALGFPGELDATTLAAQRAQLETWLRRLPGRFRIEGRVETPGGVTVQIVGADPRNGMVDQQIATTLQGKVTGIADCASIGEGVGLHCIINASWRTIDMDMPAIGSQPTISESLNTLTPAMLDLGLNLDPPGVRAQLVTDDSIAHIWAGRLMENTLKADRVVDCKEPLVGDPPDQRCLQPLEIIAEPGSEIVTIILRTVAPPTPPWASQPEIPLPRLTITLTMHRDPEAEAGKPMKTKKSR